MEKNNELVQSNIKEIGETATKALVSAVPILGGPLSSILGDYFSGRKEKRFIDFLQGIQNDLKNKESLINDEFVTKEDFYDIFELTSRKIVLTRQKEKREAYRKILTNSMTSKDICYDEMEEFISIVDNIRPEHILILKILQDPVKYDQQNGNLVGNGGGFTTSISQIISKLLPGWDNATIIDVLEKLENERLVGAIAKIYNTMMTDKGIYQLANRLTGKGIKFCKYIFE